MLEKTKESKELDFSNVTDKDLLEELKRLRLENDSLKKQTKIVGVRWYGHGGVGIGLSFEINGTKRIELQGYGAKGPIDYSTWLRAKNWPVVQEGILVRDDTVLKEINTIGIVAQEDTYKNPNAFTDDDIKNLILDTIEGKSEKKIKNTILNIDSHQIVFRIYEKFKKEKNSKLYEIRDLLWNQYKLLETRYRWSKLDKWDVIMACENAGIDIENADKINDPSIIAKLRDKLINRELEFTQD